MDNTNTLLIVPGMLGSIGAHVGSAGVYRCPSDMSWTVIDGKRHSRVRSYSMNHWLAAFSEGSDVVVFFTESDLAKYGPEKFFVFLDEHEDSIDNAAFDFLPNKGSRTSFVSYPGSRHSRGSLLTFANGSVLHKKWKDRRTVRPVQFKTITSGASPNNVDAEWIVEHMTVLQ